MVNTGLWAVGKYALFVQKQGHAAVERQKGIALPAVEDVRELTKNLPEAVLVKDLVSRRSTTI